MRLRWTVPAADDLQNIKNYPQQNFPHFAEPTVRAIYQRIRSLKTSPNRGRPGHHSGTRELAITPLPYVVVYAVKAEAVENPAYLSRGARLALITLLPGTLPLSSASGETVGAPAFMPTTTTL